MKRTSIFLCVFAVSALAVVTFAGAAQAFHGHGPAFRPATFAVISDPHFYDVKLGTTGEAFETYLSQDRKMIRESDAILNSAILKILAKKPDFVIVSGDLTKDGERSSHEKFARRLAVLENAGIKVFVCPGNHDINNPHAYSYTGAEPTPVPNVSPREFAKIYRDFGYGGPLDRDTHSLSYLAEPVKGLWLLSIDSAKYEDNAPQGPLGTTPPSITSGAIRPETMTWMLKKIADGQKRGKTVIAFMHHGVTEHYRGQADLFSEYVIDNWEADSQNLAGAGFKMVFTGHYHANDITRTVPPSTGGLTLVDVETGSLVTYPSPIRMVSVQNGQAAIHTEYVTKINYDTGGKPFPEYAKEYLTEGLEGIVYYTLKYGYGLTDPDTIRYTPTVVAAFIAHYAGDEVITPDAMGTILELLADTAVLNKYMLGQALWSLWTDLCPRDTNGFFDIVDAVAPTSRGDLDGDGEVDHGDVALVLFHLNQPAAVFPAADLDNDRTISIADIQELAKLRTCPFSWK